jgi:hypothetical protein
LVLESPTGLDEYHIVPARIDKKVWKLNPAVRYSIVTM